MALSDNDNLFVLHNFWYNAQNRKVLENKNVWMCVRTVFTDSMIYPPMSQGIWERDELSYTHLHSCMECVTTYFIWNLRVCYAHCVQRLCSGAHGTLIPCGFMQPSDASDEDVSLWVAAASDHHNLTADIATYIVELVSDIFCSIVWEEHQAISWNKPHSMEFLFYRPSLFFFFSFRALFIYFVCFVCWFWLMTERSFDL